MKTLTIYLVAFAMLVSTVPILGQSLSKIKSRKIKEVLVQVVETDKKGEEEVIQTLKTFDHKGNLLAKATLRPDGSVKSRTTYEYNRQGEETARRKYNSKNQLVQEKITVYHRYFGKPTKMVYRKNGKPHKTKIFTYDFDGNQMLETTHDGNGKVVRERSYDYDAKGMISKKVETQGNGAVTKVDYHYQY